VGRFTVANIPEVGPDDVHCIGGVIMTDSHKGIVLDVTPFDAAPDKDFLERLDHPVLVCHGPDWGHACPLLKEGCEKLDDAHGVIFQLDLERPQHRVILEKYQRVLDEEVPIVVVVEKGQEVTYADLLAGVEVWTDRPTIAQLDGFAAQVEAVDDFT
jgi:hypothetical protein